MTKSNVKLQPPIGRYRKFWLVTIKFIIHKRILFMCIIIRVFLFSFLKSKLAILVGKLDNNCKQNESSRFNFLKLNSKIVILRVPVIFREQNCGIFFMFLVLYIESFVCVKPLHMHISYIFTYLNLYYRNRMCAHALFFRHLSSVYCVLFSNALKILDVSLRFWLQNMNLTRKESLSI